MRNRLALVRAAGPALQRCELTFLQRQAVDWVRAATQHGDYCKHLAAAGVRVESLPADPDLPDGVFIEDTAVVLDDVAVLARPGAASRRWEVAGVEPVLAQYRTLKRIQHPGTLDGGDILQVGNRLFAGLSSRTNAAGIRQLREVLANYGYNVCEVAVHGCLHLKTAVTALDERTVLLNPEWIDTQPFAQFSQIPVAPSEPFAANTLRLGDTLCLSTSHPRTRAQVEALGYRTIAVDISELEKAEGGLTCLSLLFCV